MTDNIFPINGKPKTKTDRFKIFVGNLDQDGQVVEKDQAGFAYQKQGSMAFRMKLWMYLTHPYFLVPTKADQTKYYIYSIDEYLSKNNEKNSFWNKVGSAELYGNYLKIDFHLLEKTLFMSLFAEVDEPQGYEVAA